ncbi:25231_t:CDS:1, partial [Gigaspora rosea]
YSEIGKESTSIYIAKLELEATLLGLELFGKKLAYYWVTVFIDNIMAQKTIDSENKPLVKGVYKKDLELL